MLPTERLDYSAIAERKPLTLPGGARLAVWVIVNVEEWDTEGDDAAHRADPAGRRRADARHPELGLARIRQPGRVLAHARGVRRSAHPGRAGDQRLGDRRATSRSCAPRASATGSSSATASARRTCRRSPTSATTSAAPRAAIREATGKNPRGWLGPGLTETWETPDLLAEEGYDYVCDWVLDDEPVVLKTRGRPIVNIPYTQECNDVAMMLIQHHKASEYRDRAIDQFDAALQRCAALGPRHGAGRCTPTSWARRTASNTSATRSPISAATTTSCSGPASRYSTGIWGSEPAVRAAARISPEAIPERPLRLRCSQ